MKEKKALSPLADEMVKGMSAFCDAAEASKTVGKRFTIRTVSLDLEARPYGPRDVKRVRAFLKASQSLLAKFLGVSVKTIRSWEQGSRPVPTIACRYMDDIVANPEVWLKRVQIVAPKSHAEPTRT